MTEQMLRLFQYVRKYLQIGMNLGGGLTAKARFVDEKMLKNGEMRDKLIEMTA